MYYTNCCRDEKPTLPVPSDILSMFEGQDKSNVRDDPALHEGRIRSFAHERGNWSSLVYIPRMYFSVILYAAVFEVLVLVEQDPFVLNHVAVQQLHENIHTAFYAVYSVEFVS